MQIISHLNVVAACSSEMQLTITDFMFDSIFLIDMMVCFAQFHSPEVASKRSLNRVLCVCFKTQVTLCTALPIAPGRLKPERRFREIARHYFRNVFPKEVARRLPYSESRVEENARNKPLSAQRQQTLWPTRTATFASNGREEQRTFPAH